MLLEWGRGRGGATYANTLLFTLIIPFNKSKILCRLQPFKATKRLFGRDDRCTNLAHRASACIDMINFDSTGLLTLVSDLRTDVGEHCERQGSSVAGRHAMPQARLHGDRP